MALNEDDMQRISEEEIYRHEVRVRLDKEHKKSGPRKEKLWVYVNSPFSLWVLSTIVVGLISWGYAHYQDSVRKSEENRETARRLKAETDNRSKEILKLTAQIIDESKAGKEYYDPRSIYKMAVQFLDGEKDPSLSAFQPVLEFKEKTWKVLVDDLEKAEGPEASGSAVLRTKYETLKTLWDETQPASKEGEPNDEESKKAIDAATKVSEIIKSS